jgi:hypothetical protein
VASSVLPSKELANIDCICFRPIESHGRTTSDDKPSSRASRLRSEPCSRLKATSPSATSPSELLLPPSLLFVRSNPSTDVLSFPSLAVTPAPARATTPPTPPSLTPAMPLPTSPLLSRPASETTASSTSSTSNFPPRTSSLSSPLSTRASTSPPAMRRSTALLRTRRILGRLGLVRLPVLFASGLPSASRLICCSAFFRCRPNVGRVRCQVLELGASVSEDV